MDEVEMSSEKLNKTFIDNPIESMSGRLKECIKSKIE